MPLYEYICYDCGHTDSLVCAMGASPEALWCGRCDQDMGRNYRINTFSFKPYVERNFTGRPILIESAEQRDALCEEHGASYDSLKYTRPKKQGSVVEDIDYGDIKKELDNVSDDELRRIRNDTGGDPFGGEVSTVEVSGE